MRQRERDKEREARHRGTGRQRKMGAGEKHRQNKETRRLRGKLIDIISVRGEKRRVMICSNEPTN